MKLTTIVIIGGIIAAIIAAYFGQWALAIGFILGEILGYIVFREELHAIWRKEPS